jgi:hypothetical protein
VACIREAAATPAGGYGVEHALSLEARAVIVGDRHLTAQALRVALGNEDFATRLAIGHATLDSLIHALTRVLPKVIVFDVNVERTSYDELSMTIAGLSGLAPVVAVTGSEDPAVLGGYLMRVQPPSSASMRRSRTSRSPCVASAPAGLHSATTGVGAWSRRSVSAASGICTTSSERSAPPKPRYWPL